MTDEPTFLPEAPPGQRVLVVEMPYDELPRRRDGITDHVQGMTLERLIQELGGYEGYLTHPFSDERFFVSLSEFHGRDPKDVWLYVSIVDPP